MSQTITLLLGQQRYRLQKHWIAADLAAGISSVAVLSDGKVAVLLRGSPCLVRVFDADANLINNWTVEGIRCAHQISALPDGGMLICDLDGHQVVALNQHGQAIWTLGTPDQPKWQAPFNHPTHAIVCPKGELYVSDGYGNACIHHFDAQRTLVSSFGQHGTAALTPGQDQAQFSVPHTLAHDGQLLYVADRENSRVLMLDKHGRVHDQITTLYKPMAIALDGQGRLFVSDQTAALSMFDAHRKLIGRCRVTAVYGHGLAYHPNGSIFIAEMLSDGLTCLVPC